MDIKKIFELFEIEGKGVPISDDELDVIEKFDIFKDTPIYKIGMFVKIILNYNVIKNQILKYLRNQTKILIWRMLKKQENYSIMVGPLFG